MDIINDYDREFPMLWIMDLWFYYIKVHLIHRWRVIDGITMNYSNLL
ncbi:MAG TPA: hypothetical protein VJ964_12705 [Balneolaceae bacterium]|nr:hypothetical protein [Balneolaceae bacterium]